MVDTTNDASKQIFNLAERMAKTIDEAAESLDVFSILPLKSSRHLIAAIKSKYAKRHVNQETIKALLQSLNNVYRLEESFRVIHKIATPQTPHSLKASRGSISSNNNNNNNLSSRQKSRQSSSSRQFSTTPSILPKTPEILHPQEDDTTLYDDTQQLIHSQQIISKKQPLHIKVNINVDLSDWGTQQIESMNDIMDNNNATIPQKQTSSPSTKKSPYVIVKKKSTPDVTMKIQSVKEGTPQARYNDGNTMKAIKSFLIAVRAVDDFKTILKECDNVKTSPIMKDFVNHFREALKKGCYRIQTTQDVLDKDKLYSHNLQERVIKNENEIELLQSVIDKERNKFIEKRDEYDRAIKSWNKVVNENKIEWKKLDIDASSWLKVEETNINVNSTEQINILTKQRDEMKKMVDDKIAQNRTEVLKYKRRNNILKAEVQNKVDKYDVAMNEIQSKIDSVQNDIELIHDKIKKYEFKWAKQNYEDQKLKEAQELLRSKRIMAESYWTRREKGAVALQKIYKGWRYRTYGDEK